MKPWRFSKEAPHHVRTAVKTSLPTGPRKTVSLADFQRALTLFAEDAFSNMKKISTG
jgi:hypothetical protein